MKLEQKLQQIINEAIETQVFPGCVIGIVNRKREKNILPFGKFTYNSDAPDMKENTIFDVASITKAIPTSCLALKALEMGKVKLNDALVNWIPEYNNSHRDEVLVKHLMTHTLDFDFRLSECKDLTPEKILETVYNAELRSAPGSKCMYSNATSILLGIVVERVFSKNLETLAKEFFFDPLGMSGTTFSPDKNSINEIVPTEIDDWRGREIRGEIHDESARVLNKIMTPGSAGLFSCVPDLLNFMEMIIQYGMVKSEQFLRRDTITLLSTNQIAETGDSTGLGWELNQPHYMGTCISSRTIGKTGFTGCVVMADLERGIGLVMLSNYTWPHRKEGKKQINAVRSQVADSVYGN